MLERQKEMAGSMKKHKKGMNLCNRSKREALVSSVLVLDIELANLEKYCLNQCKGEPFCVLGADLVRGGYSYMSIRI